MKDEIADVIALGGVVAARPTLGCWATNARPAVQLEPVVRDVERELLRRWDALDAISRTLIVRGTIDGERVRQLYEAHPRDEIRRDGEREWGRLLSALSLGLQGARRHSVFKDRCAAYGSRRSSRAMRGAISRTAASATTGTPSSVMSGSSPRRLAIVVAMLVTSRRTMGVMSGFMVFLPGGSRPGDHAAEPRLVGSIWARSRDHAAVILVARGRITVAAIAAGLIG